VQDELGMSPKDLSSELRRSAEATAASIRESARAEARRLRDEADALIQRRLRNSLEEEEARARSEARRSLATARQEAMRALLLAKARLVDRVLERAKEGLPAASRSQAYLQQLPSQLEEALRYVNEDQPARVRCPADLVQAVTSAVPNRPELSVEADPELNSGFVVIAEDGSLKVDKRLERALEEAKTDLAIAIQARLEELGDALLSR
jgi:vacuolar-type H+-ATPase subunit E/Vma4